MGPRDVEISEKQFRPRVFAMPSPAGSEGLSAPYLRRCHEITMPLCGAASSGCSRLSRRLDPLESESAGCIAGCIAQCHILFWFTSGKRGPSRLKPISHAALAPDS